MKILLACNFFYSDRPATLLGAKFSYHRFLNILRKKDFLKLPAETPEEFAQKLGPPLLRDQAREFTRLYNAARYGGQRPSLPLLAGLLQELSGIAGSARHTK